MSSAPPKLSRREREVARLVAEGLTSKEIGQRLFISERTAEGHVEQIRSKLGFRTRAQIAAWVATETLTPAAAPAQEPPAPPPARRRPEQRLTPRMLWLSGAAMALAALVIVTATVLVPALNQEAPGPRIETFAGTGSGGLSTDGNPARGTNLITPNGIVASPTGDVYIADGNRIRVVRTDGRVYTVAGSGSGGFTGDQGPALAATLRIASPGMAELTGLALDGKGDLFVADTGNDRVREITPDGKIFTVAGAGPPGHSFQLPNPADLGDGGPGTEALLAQPRGLAIDAQGNLLIADTGDNRVRRLDPGGVITTAAGTGEIGWAGDGGPAVAAELSAPEGLAIDVQGDLFIADTGNERVRKVAGGVITTVAGNGSSGFSGDGGQGTKAELNLPLGLAADTRGNLYIADTANFRVRMLDLSGTIATMAGNGQAGFGGDSHQATTAMLNLPVAVAVSGTSRVYIADSGNNRIRLVETGSG